MTVGPSQPFPVQTIVTDMHGYTERVRKLVVALIVLVASLAAVDPLLCPDGCTDNASSVHPGACLFCQNGIVTTEGHNPITARRA